MLAQNFKTPAELKIREAEFNALANVLRMLEREELKHIHVTPAAYVAGRVDFYEGRKFDALFNMVGFAEQAECGTTACIAGTCDLVFGTTFAQKYWTAGNLPPNLIELFSCSEFTNARMATIRPDEAAIALRNYLTHGEPRWAEALAG